MVDRGKAPPGWPDPAAPAGVRAELARRVERWVRPEVRALHAYHVQESAGLIKLDAMESPYPWPGELAGEWLQTLRAVQANRYPDPAAARLKERLREVLGVPAGLELVLGNGSDELIQLVVLAVAAPGRVVLAPEPTFVMYRMIALAAGVEYASVDLQAGDFALPRAALLDAVAKRQPAVSFVAWPNNPTGNLFDGATVEALLRSADGAVVMDEAYAPFAGESFLPRIGEYPNLLVMRTLSKLGLAGLRLGFLAGPAEWLSHIEKLRLPYNVSVLTQVSAEFALRHYDVIEAQTARLREARAVLSRALAGIDGVATWPSHANFVLFRVPAGRAAGVHAGLRRHGVLIKNLDGVHPLLADCLRVTVGTPGENEAFLQALRALL